MFSSRFSTRLDAPVHFSLYLRQSAPSQKTVVARVAAFFSILYQVSHCIGRLWGACYFTLVG
eukprot:6214510-Pleurochrysis_carterae.AAC.4